MKSRAIEWTTELARYYHPGTGGLLVLALGGFVLAIYQTSPLAAIASIGLAVWVGVMSVRSERRWRAE